LGAKLLDIQAGRQFVDRYELIGEIASGGMATVYLARLTGVGGFQRLFAIKRLHPHLQGEKEFVEMFLDEARLAAGIHHPNVVPILEVGASPGGYYLVMEYIEGETLARLLARAASKKERLPVPMVLRMTLDMLSGLHAAHELKDENGILAGVVHRDVSPQNVLVGVDGVSRITDFGVARAASRLTATRVGQLKGKIAYMAPEQARGEEDVDRRADVFAAGVVVWEALAHRRLFKAASEAGTLSRVLNDPLPHLHEVAPHVDPGVCAVIMQALDRDRDRRLADCARFADALERAAAAAGVLGSSRDLRGYMDHELGSEVMVQREALRAWTARADAMGGAPPHVTPSVGPSATTPGVATDAGIEESINNAARGPGRTFTIVAALLLLAVGGFLGYRSFGGEEAAPNAGMGQVAPPVVVAEEQSKPTGDSPTEKRAEEKEPHDETPAEVEATELTDEPAEEELPRPVPVRPAPRPRAQPAPSRPAPRPVQRPSPRPSGNDLDVLGSNPYR
jgi:serine/threonine-protein kinase